MKPITEEQRQALINRIRNIKITGKANRFEISEIAEIALASLTAEPVAKTDVSGCVWMNDGESSRKPPVSTPLYTAPPVPVIKFPDWCQKVPGGNLDINADLVRYHFMEEIKLLNWQGE